MTNPILIDMSHWQPDPIDWGKLHAAGTVGVIFKATESTNYTDPTLKSRAAAAKAAGLCISTYHFLRPTSIKDQMAFYLKTVNPVQGERMCLDHEDSGVSLDKLKEAVQILLDDERGLQVTIYSGHVIKDQLGSKDDQFLRENTSLWIAQYTSSSSPSWPSKVWPQWSLWQYTDQAKVSGINGNVDGNRWNGTSETLIDWMTPAGEVKPVPPPEPPPAPEQQVLVAITVPEGVDALITVNGVPVG
jgi:lysozyme